jgi:hypothetical protein
VVSIKTYKEFWDWFLTNEKKFYTVLKEAENIEKDFFDKLSQKLNELKEGFWFLAGMHNETTAELILTPDGEIKNIVFVEELVSIAPKLGNWKFTALKPALDVNDTNIEMTGYKFNQHNLHFYSNEINEYPDEIDICVVYDDFKKDDQAIINGVYIFLDNFLGELNSVTTIDNLKITSRQEAEKELIPIAKLKSFLIWREKEFIEKYKGTRYKTENDSYSTFEATMENGDPMFAVVNTDLLKWDRKASHPWILEVIIKFDGNEHGMPDSETYKKLDAIEDSIMLKLKDSDGYLNIGRQTADNERVIYFACKDFRLPSKVIYDLKQSAEHSVEIEYYIFKDKYWRTFNRFNVN